MQSTALDSFQVVAFQQSARRSPAEAASRVLWCHFAVLVLAGGAGLTQQAMQFNPESLIYPACLGVTLSFVWILASWFSIRRTLFDPYALFMTVTALFNAGQAFLEVFGWNLGPMLHGRAAPETLLGGVYLVMLCLLTAHCGALIAVTRQRPAGPPDAVADPRRKRAARLTGAGLLAVSIVPVFLLISRSLSIVLDYGYMGLYKGNDPAALIWIFSGLLIPGTVFLLAGAKGHRWLQGFCIGVAGLYALINLFLGTRGTAVVGTLAVIWIFDRMIRRIPRLWIAVACVLALFVFSLVRETRITGGRWRLSLDEQLDTLGRMENPVAGSISEMGYSMVTVTHTLDLVPAIREFDAGVSYLYAMLTLVPNVGWEVHPGKAHGLLGEWLVKTVEPDVAASGGGLGYSCIAEAYLNFGWFGGPLFVALMGYGFTRVFLVGDRPDPVACAMVASFLATFLMFGRAESATVLRGVVWYAFVPFWISGALCMGRRRRGWR